MKKSTVYTWAMEALIYDETLDASQKLEAIEVLIEDRKVALWSEEQEAKKNESVSD